MDLSDLHPQVLQKLGKTVETKDERFEQSANNFYHQQVSVPQEGGKWKLGKRKRHEGWAAEYRFCKPASIPTGPGPEGVRATGRPAACPSPGNQRNLSFLFQLTLGNRPVFFSLRGSPRVQWHHWVLSKSKWAPASIVFGLFTPWGCISLPCCGSSHLISIVPYFPCCFFVHYVYLT